MLREIVRFAVLGCALAAAIWMLARYFAVLRPRAGTTEWIGRLTPPPWQPVSGCPLHGMDAPAALLLTEECTRTVVAVQLLPPFVWEDPLPPLPDTPAALTLTLTMQDVEAIDTDPAALGRRLVERTEGKRWLHHPRVETFLAERVALFQRVYRG